MKDRLNSALQENLITILAYDDVNGRLIARTAELELFEGDYRVIAERCVKFWEQQNQAPKLHTADLLSDILDDPKNRRAATYRRLLGYMVQLAQSVNTQYVMEQLRTFTRFQRLKDAIGRSAERLNSQQEFAIDEVEEIWSDLLRTRQVDFDPGLRLTEVDRILTYLQTHFSEFGTGIAQLDRRFVVPSRGACTLWLAATGRGKTWALIHIGKQALLDRKKVLHISFEMSEEQVAQRYYQNLFGVSKRDSKVIITTFKKDRFDRIEDFGQEEVKPDFTFASQFIKTELEVRMTHLGAKMTNLFIARFTPRSMTPNKLRAFLDNLEIVEKFIPDILVLDYVGIMHTDPNNHRVTLGRTFEDLRAISIDRHVALVTAQQISKEGTDSTYVKATHIAEDNSLTHTADQVITYSQTEQELRHGLARLYVSKARDEEDKFGVLLSQNYKIGQFVLDSVMLDSNYFESIKRWSAVTDDDRQGNKDE